MGKKLLDKEEFQSKTMYPNSDWATALQEIALPTPAHPHTCLDSLTLNFFSNKLFGETVEAC
jgi:hypothetical protein